MTAAVTSPRCSIFVGSSGWIYARSISAHRRANIALAHKYCAVKLYREAAIPVTLAGPLAMPMARCPSSRSVPELPGAQMQPHPDYFPGRTQILLRHDLLT